ncbi:MAG: hypothetical protein KAG98_00065 [Lentisphaeria bacterium]|nr:hypothetical protein [Lentisphaeria bacterium]
MAEQGDSQEVVACSSCGGDVKFTPGSTEVECNYCGATTEIEVEERVIVERDFAAVLAKVKGQAPLEEEDVLTCSGCGANIEFDADCASDSCDFCGKALLSEGHKQKLIKPQALLPFKISKADSSSSFKSWLNSRWFLPNQVKQMHQLRPINGCYIPFWTYDALTDTSYTGQRGEYYYVTEYYTVQQNGKSVRRSRQVRKTRWYAASGVVRDSFDDLLVLASNSLPRKYADELEPWDLEELVPYTRGFLAGYRVETYGVDLEEGFTHAETQMKPVIESHVKRDIGGDVQRISSVNLHCKDISFKHILLPIWISTYIYKERPYRFLVNARTAEVQGERPWCPLKISLAVLTVAVVIAGIAFAIAQNQ